jgi:predicted nucleic acid-binding protein
MAVYFLDSSALAKRYIAEIGSVWVGNIMRPAGGNRVHILRITGAEVMAAIARRTRGGSLGQAEAELASRQLRADFIAALRISEVSAQVFAGAMDLAWRRGSRGYDAVRLSAAIELNREYREAGIAMTMLRSDVQFNAAAAAESITVDGSQSPPIRDEGCCSLPLSG